MAAVEEDFSFPVITETQQASIDSPPLWHLSPAASSPNHNYSCNKLSPKEDYYKQRKSCSNIDMTHYNSTEEDKMDFLWEDYFNQEVSKLEANNYKNMNSSSGGMVELGRVQALKFSKNGNGAIFSASKKPSIVMFIKVLKKLFLIHNNSHRNNRSVKQNRA